MGRLSDEVLDRRIWAWLPARADRRRVTVPAVIAAAQGVPLAEVLAALERMETSGHAIRDRAQGRRSTSWHRGPPYPCRDGDASGEILQEGLWA